MCRKSDGIFCMPNWRTCNDSLTSSNLAIFSVTSDCSMIPHARNPHIMIRTIGSRLLMNYTFEFILEKMLLIWKVGRSNILISKANLPNPSCVCVSWEPWKNCIICIRFHRSKFLDFKIIGRGSIYSCSFHDHFSISRPFSHHRFQNTSVPLRNFREPILPLNMKLMMPDLFIFFFFFRNLMFFCKFLNSLLCGISMNIEHSSWNIFKIKR